MLKTKDIPIKYQLITMIFAISFISLWIAGTAFSLYDRHAYKESMSHELTILARVVANRTASAIVINDKNQASEILNSLGAKATILSACITNEAGETVAAFSREYFQKTNLNMQANDLECLHDQAFISRFSDQYLDLLQPVMLNESEKVGELHIREDLTLLHKRFQVFTVVMLLIVVLASLIAIALSSRIQGFVSAPILSLIETTDRITRNKDYSIRAQKYRQDELGRLVDAMNSMMDTIDLQNRALLEARDNLEDQVKVRTVELRNINRELEAFTYSVSHDLRAPLRSVDGFSAALLEDFSANLDVTGRDYLHRIRLASERMSTLIDSLLYLSRVARQDVAFQAVDLAPMATDIAERLSLQYTKNSIHFSCPKMLLAYGDKALLAILLENLLANAWKYSETVTAPRVEIGVVDRKGEQVYFIRDNGVGFDMKFLDKLFGPFQRLHRPDEFEGLGIGLATAARIVHRHGGELWAEAMVGSGAVFYFTLGVRS